MPPKKSGSKPASPKKSTRRPAAAKRPEEWEAYYHIQKAVEFNSKGKAHRRTDFDWEASLDEFGRYHASKTVGEALKHLRAVLVADPANIDALSALADEARLESDSNLAARILILKAARHALGRDYQEYMGSFWGFHETRPYMRAAFALAQAHLGMSNPLSALDVYMHMLDLNPNDNQGIRYCALPLSMAAVREDATRLLLEKFPDEGGTVFAWCRLALLFMDGDPAPEEALEALAEARASNRHVEDLLLSPPAEDLPYPNLYSIGSIEEAHCYIDDIALAFMGVPSALEWLRTQGSGGAGAKQLPGSPPAR